MAFVAAHGAQQVYGSLNACGILAGHARLAAALAANGNVERLVALLAQLGQRHIPAHVHAAVDVHAQLPQYVNLGVNDVFLELEGGDTVPQHTAGTLVFLKHGGLVALGRQEVGAAQARRAAADDEHICLQTAPLQLYILHIISPKSTPW